MKAANSTPRTLLPQGGAGIFNQGSPSDHVLRYRSHQLVRSFWSVWAAIWCNLSTIWCIRKLYINNGEINSGDSPASSWQFLFPESHLCDLRPLTQATAKERGWAILEGPLVGLDHIA